MSKTRSFRVGVDRVVTLPVDLTEGTAHTRLHGGDIIELDASRVAAHQRYIARSLRNGDLEEVQAGTPTAVLPREPGPEGKAPEPPPMSAGKKE